MSKKNEKFWRMELKSIQGDSGIVKTVGEILLYGILSESTWWGDEVTPKAFSDELKALGNIDELIVRINSRGGDVFAGTTIHSLLRGHKAKVTVHVDGLAASAASVVAMAGDVVVMPGNALMMIHNPWTCTAGDADDLRKDADTLDVIRESMIAAYQAKTGLGRQKIIALLEAETWMTAEDAVSLGFADVAEEPLAVAASLRGNILAIGGEEFDLSDFKNAPMRLATQNKEEIHLDGKTTETNGSAASELKTSTASFDIERFRSENPDGYAIVLAEGVRQERERQKEIDALATPGLDEIIRKAKYETGETPEQVAVAIVKEQKALGANAFAARVADAQASGVQNIVVNITPDGMGVGEDAKAKTAAAIRGEIEKRRGIQ